ncbi:MAG: hypothetical protein AB7K52_07145 [Phycisphaerales bacterium]
MSKHALDSRLVPQIAALAHACWRASRRADGWKRGRFDPDRRTHDAMGAFDRLTPEDRELIAIAVESSEMSRLLAELVDLPRGPERPFTTRELRRGQPVGLANGVRIDQPGVSARAIGRVHAWESQPGSVFPRSITVHWPGGALTRHAPLDRDLRRVDPSLS